ncbi:MAG: CapA family protein [Kiritimatiellae bacterium]|nr:CapA family protein [Kiritimatiellia bacterium]
MANAKVVLAAVGDVSFSGVPGDAVRANGHAFPFEKIRPWLAEADIRFGNMESILFPADFPAAELDPKGLTCEDSVAPSLREAGFDVMNLAQNHVLDCGTRGLQHTRKRLAELGIGTFGAGLTPEEARRPLVLARNGLRIGFLGYQEDCNYTCGHVGAGPAYLVEAHVLADLRALRPQVDVLVLSMHSDLEFMETPAVWRRDLSRRLAAAGADLILHTHPHVPQGVERRGRSLIAYSLGNCLFAAHSSEYMKAHAPHTAHAFVLRVTLSSEGAGEFERLPFEIGEPPEERPVPMTGARLAAGLAYLAQLDAALADEAAVRENWRRKCLQMLGSCLRRAAGLTPEQFMERWGWILLGIQENRSWMAELGTMAMEQFERQAAAPKPSLEYRRPRALYG